MRRELSGLRESMDRFDVADARIIPSEYDDLSKFVGKQIVVSNIFN
jgi:hypothetical protein